MHTHRLTLSYSVKPNIPTITTPNHHHTCNSTPTISASALSILYIHFLSLKTSAGPTTPPPSCIPHNNLAQYALSIPFCHLRPLEQEPQGCNSICDFSRGGLRLILCNSRAFRSPSPCGEERWREQVGQGKWCAFTVFGSAPYSHLLQ